MKHAHLSKFIPALAVSLLLGCDYVDQPLDTGNGGNGGGGDDVVRRVLLEDITGHLCNNCPAAAQIAAQLQGVYGSEELVVVAIHAGDYFSGPANPPNGDGSYSTNFQTVAGNEYADTWSISFLPTGMVSRRLFNNSITLSESAWGSAVAEIIGEPADLEIWFESLDYQGGSIETTVKVAVLNDLAGDHNLTVYLTEDHIIDWQYDNQASPPNVPDYEHRHVLRDNLNGTWGEVAVSGAASAGDTLTFTYTRPIAANVLEPDNCSLVAYVYNTTTYEVMQVRERKFQP